MPDSNLCLNSVTVGRCSPSNRKQETVPLGLLKLGQLLQPSVRLQCAAKSSMKGKVEF